jgi:hypothetical protein
MLEHYFWLLEFKFKFEFHCLNPFLNPFSKLAKPSHLSLSPPFLSGPRFACGPSAGSSSVPLFLFSGGHAQQPSSQLRKPSPARPFSQRRRPLACAASGPAAAQPSWPSGPRRRQPAPRLCAPCAADLWGPGVIPYLASASSRTLPPPESERSLPPSRGPHAKESTPGLFKRAAALGRPTRDPVPYPPPCRAPPKP